LLTQDTNQTRSINRNLRESECVRETETEKETEKDIDIDREREKEPSKRGVGD
jgi:hypothetical protein